MQICVTRPQCVKNGQLLTLRLFSPSLREPSFQTEGLALSWEYFLLSPDRTLHSGQSGDQTCFCSGAGRNGNAPADVTAVFVLLQ